MDFSISHEATVLFWSTLGGVCIAFIFDLFRALRLKAHTETFFSGIHDIVFWLIATVIMFFIIFFTNNGTLRLYQFFGAFSGAMIYFLLLSRFVLFLIGFISDKIYNFFKIFFKIVLTPLMFMYKILYVSLSFVFVPVFRLIRKIYINMILYIKKSCKYFIITLKKK